jgi:hypothetical protein
MDLPVLDTFICGIKQYVAFSHPLSKVQHVVMCLDMPLLFMMNDIHCMDISAFTLPVHQMMDTCLLFYPTFCLL